METTVSTPHCSLIIYLAKDADLLKTFMRDLRSFFGKFPVNYEVIAIVEKGAKLSLQAITEESALSSEKERIVIKQNTKKLGRAKSLIRGLSEATAPAMLIVNAEMASPLGDVFKLWQHLITEEQVDITWGNRYSKKDSPFMTSASPRVRTEHFFNNIMRSKEPEAIQDPLCEVLAIKKTAWQKIYHEISLGAVRGWYLSPALQRCPSFHKLNVIEVPIFDSGAMSHSYSTWIERWHLMRQANAQSDSAEKTQTPNV
ncbi:hypothetical protein DOE51_05280 [Bdellovibrio sp. NC01]|nr:hypothetical protein DOE51_05280 [Bdellovibrio sp. NC01]